MSSDSHNAVSNLQSDSVEQHLVFARKSSRLQARAADKTCKTFNLKSNLLINSNINSKNPSLGLECSPSPIDVITTYENNVRRQEGGKNYEVGCILNMALAAELPKPCKVQSDLQKAPIMEICTGQLSHNIHSVPEDILMIIDGEAAIQTNKNGSQTSCSRKSTPVNLNEPTLKQNAKAAHETTAIISNVHADGEDRSRYAGMSHSDKVPTIIESADHVCDRPKHSKGSLHMFKIEEQKTSENVCILKKDSMQSELMVKESQDGSSTYQLDVKANHFPGSTVVTEDFTQKNASKPMSSRCMADTDKISYVAEVQNQETTKSGLDKERGQLKKTADCRLQHDVSNNLPLFECSPSRKRQIAPSENMNKLFKLPVGVNSSECHTVDSTKDVTDVREGVKQVMAEQTCQAIPVRNSGNVLSLKRVVKPSYKVALSLEQKKNTSPKSVQSQSLSELSFLTAERIGSKTSLENPRNSTHTRFTELRVDTSQQSSINRKAKLRANYSVKGPKSPPRDKGLKMVDEGRDRQAALITIPKRVNSADEGNFESKVKRTITEKQDMLSAMTSRKRKFNIKMESGGSTMHKNHIGFVTKNTEEPVSKLQCMDGCEKNTNSKMSEEDKIVGKTDKMQIIDEKKNECEIEEMKGKVQLTKNADTLLEDFKHTESINKCRNEAKLSLNLQKVQIPIPVKQELPETSQVVAHTVSSSRLRNKTKKRRTARVNRMLNQLDCEYLSRLKKSGTITQRSARLKTDGMSYNEAKMIKKKLLEAKKTKESPQHKTKQKMSCTSSTNSQKSSELRTASNNKTSPSIARKTTADAKHSPKSEKRKSGNKASAKAAKTILNKYMKGKIADKVSGAPAKRTEKRKQGDGPGKNTQQANCAGKKYLMSLTNKDEKMFMTSAGGTSK